MAQLRENSLYAAPLSPLPLSGKLQSWRLTAAICASALLLLFLAGCRDPLSIRQKCFTNGNKFYDKGKFKEASILYRRALQIDAKYADAWYRLGLTDMKMGDVRGAVAALRRAIDLAPGNDDAALRLAELYAGAGLSAPENADRQQIVPMLEPLVGRFLNKNPRSYDVLRLAGYLALIKRDRKLAIEKLRAANEARPWQPEVVLALTENLAINGRPEEAERMGEELLARHKDCAPMYGFLYEHYLRTSQFDRAEEILKKRIQNVPDGGRGRIQLALNYYLAKRSREMLAVLQSLRDDRKKLPGVDGLIGDFYFLIGDPDGAVQAYRDGEKFNLKEKATYEEKAIEALLAQRKTGEAVDAAERLYKAAPKDPGIAAFRAMLRAQLDPPELQNTIATLESLVSKNGGDPLIHFYLGRTYRQKGDPESLAKARTHLETAAALRPDFIPAKTLLAQVLLLRHEGPATIQVAGDVLRRDAGNLNVRLARAMAFSMLEEPDRARQDLLVALAMHPNSTEARLRIAGLDLSQKRYREAEKGFETVARAGDPRGVVGVAQSKAAQGHVDRAIALLRVQCARFAAFHDCVSTLASLELQAGHFAEARSGFERMTQMEPGSAEPYARLANAQLRLGDSAGAIASFRKALQLNPADARSALAIAVLLDASGQTAQAAAAYEDTLRIDSGNAQALNNLAYIKAVQGADLDRALAMAQKAVQRSPDDSSYVDTLGLVYYKRGLIDESVGVFQPLVRKHPGNASFHLHLAMALYAAAKREPAAHELQMAIVHGPSPGEQIQIKDLAAKLHVSSQTRPQQ